MALNGDDLHALTKANFAARAARGLEDALGSPRVLPLVLYLGFFWLLGATPLFDHDEGAFAEATREMFERGDFFATHLDGRPRYDKPILSYWLQEAAVLPQGLNELAVRLPSALAATGWVVAVYGFGREVLVRTGAVVAGLLLINALPGWGRCCVP
jgi:4-amino-4-deoxy-L-arabinose transferase-like glycosyltransferase